MTYDWLWGIPTKKERYARDDPDMRHRDEFSAPPNTILWLETDLALEMLRRHFAYEPGQRQPYVPVAERVKDEKPVEKPKTHRRPGPTTGDSARLIRLWG